MMMHTHSQIDFEQNKRKKKNNTLCRHKMKRKKNLLWPHTYQGGYIQCSTISTHQNKTKTWFQEFTGNVYIWMCACDGASAYIYLQSRHTHRTTFRIYGVALYICLFLFFMTFGLQGKFFFHFHTFVCVQNYSQLIWHDGRSVTFFLRLI